MIDVSVNGKTQRLDVEPDTPLLWVVRETLGLTGTKFGCGMALCGACTVHLDGAAVRSCVTPVSAARGKRVTTIEGLPSGGRLHPVQDAWIEQDVPQCGYCQSGQVMSAAALLSKQKDPTDTRGSESRRRSASASSMSWCGGGPRREPRAPDEAVERGPLRRRRAPRRG